MSCVFVKFVWDDLGMEFLEAAMLCMTQTLRCLQALAGGR